jgi:hypothetical protein
MPDVKKLITGFLIIAAAASASALALSNIGAQTGAGSGALETTGTISLADQNAFMPSQADISNAVAEDAPNVAAALSDPSNLTTNLTDALLNSAAAVNPDGFNQDNNGNGEFQQPAVTSVAANFTKAPAIKSYKIPNWDTEVAAQKLNIASSASPQAYGDALNSIIVKNIIQTGASSLVGQDIDPSNMAAIEPSVQSAASDIANTPAPAQLAAFQKSLVAAMIYQKNMIALVTLAQTDPVKASIIDQAESARYDQVMADFGVQSEKASVKGLFSFNVPQTKENGTLALLQSFFGIQTAHAQWPTWDWATFGRWIKDEIESILLQILKNTLTAFLQQRVLKLIQGSGAPKFIQQWGSTLATAYTQKAIASMSQVLAKSCPNIGSQLKPIQLNLINTIGGNGKVLSCPIPSASLGQLTNFYNSFTNPNVQALPGGSWGLYAQVLNPNGGNYFGTLIGASDYANSQGSAAQGAATLKAQANNGYKGDESCPDGADPNGTSTLCSDQDAPTTGWTCPNGNTPQAFEVCLSGSNGPSGYCAINGSSPIATKYVCDYPIGSVAATHGFICDDGNPATVQNNNGSCPPTTPGGDWTEPIVTTPGQTTLQTQQQALGGTLKLVTSANNVIGVLESVGMSFLNTIVQVGITKATQLGTQYATGGLLSITAGQSGSGAAVSASSAGVQPTNSSSGPALPPTQCSPHTPTCSTGSSGQCSSGYLAGDMDFGATGGDGLTFTWSVDTSQAPGITANFNSASGPMFSVYFTAASSTINPVTGQSTLSFPITVPITVTGSDNKSDTCYAVIGQ